jgi:hypothetical protein
MMVNGALQIAAAGGKLNNDLERILSNDIQNYVEADNYYAYGGRIVKDLNMPNSYAKGGSIHIKKSKRGTFTAAAKKRGMSVQEFARQVLANKGNYSAAMVKKANFARNAAGWKHAEGGPTDPPDQWSLPIASRSNINQGSRNIITAGAGNNLPFTEQGTRIINEYDNGLKRDTTYSYMTPTENFFYNTGQNQPDGKPVMNYQGSNPNPNINDYLPKIKGLSRYAQGGPFIPEEKDILSKIEDREQYLDEAAIDTYNSIIYGQPTDGYDAFNNYYIEGAIDPSYYSGIRNGFKEFTHDGGIKDAGAYANFINKRLGRNVIIPLQKPWTGPYDLEHKKKFVREIDPHHIDPRLDTKTLQPLDPYGKSYNIEEKLRDLEKEKEDAKYKMDEYATGGPMVSNVQQPFEVAAQNRGGMLMDYANGGYVYQPMVQPMLAEGGNMYNVGGPVLDRLKRLLRLNQTGPSSLSHSQLNELMKDGNQQSESSNFNQPDNFKFKRIIGIDDNTGEPIYENKLSLPQNYTPKVNNLQINNPTTPNNFPRTNTGPGITYSMPNESIIPNEEILPSTTSLTSEIPDGTFQGVNMSGQDVSVRPEFREIYNKGLWKPEGEQTSPYLINQPNQPNQGLTGLDYASMGMQALGPLSQLYYGLQGGDDVNYQRVGVEKIDPTVAIVLANEEARRAQDLAGYNLRQNAPTSGSYMSNMRALGLQAGKQRGAQTAAKRFEADKVNTDSVNRTNALNAQIAMQEQIDRLQEKDAARTNVTEGLSGLGSTTANVIRDYRTNQINQMIANNIGTNDYKFDMSTNEIVFRRNGKEVRLPIETVVPPNIQANVGTGQIQKKGQSQFNLNFDKDLMKQFRKSFNQTSNKP